jgi:hypothetical protein
MATTAYVATAVTNGLGTLGTMATQNSNNVTITGGTINGVSGTNASLTVGTATNATNATNATTAVTVSTTVASGAVGTTQASSTNNTQIATTAFVQAVVRALYPIGSIYSSTSATNPAATFGFGTWDAYAAGRVLVGAGGAFSGTGGSADAVIVSHSHGGVTQSQSANHVHTLAGTTGGQSVSHNHSTLEPSGGTYQNAGGNFGWDYISAVYGSTANGTFVTGGASVDHSHTFSTTTDANNVGHVHQINTDGVSGTNANMQPYQVVYMWVRSA